MVRCKHATHTLSPAHHLRAIRDGRCGRYCTKPTIARAVSLSLRSLTPLQQRAGSARHASYVNQTTRLRRLERSLPMSQQHILDAVCFRRTILACKLSKYREVFTPATRWSAHGPHHTNACPWCVVCVVGALGSFPHCKGVNGSSENGAFEAPMEIQNKLSTFALHHV